MGKGRKNRKPQPAAASAPAQRATPGETPSITAFSAPRDNLVRRIAWQLAAVLVLSVALGFVFNAANPIGVRFQAADSGAKPRAGTATDFHLLSTSSIAAKNPAALPPPQPSLTVPTSSPAPPQLPTAAANPIHTSTIVPVPNPQMIIATATSPTVAVAASNPVAATLLPTNPVAIHWRDAKPLMASGHAVLVDVRPRPVYDAGHIPDAVSMPETSSSAEFAAFLKLLPADTTVIVYCSSTSCSQSKRVSDRLVTEFHHPSVKYMTGGYQEYQQEELAKPQQPAEK